MERERIERIAEEIGKTGIKPEIKDINGVTKLLIGEEPIKLVINIDKMDSLTDETIIQGIIKIANNNQEIDRAVAMGKLIRDYDKVYDKIRIQLLPIERRETVVRREFLDLVMVPSIHIDSYSIKITKELLEHWGITEDELFETAMWNTKKKVIIRDICDMTERLADTLDLPLEVVEMYQQARGTMYVMTTTDDYAGAAAMCMEGAFWSMANSLEQDIIIIPSSTEEVILIPSEGIGVSKKDIYEMVSQVNTELVSEQGRKLSDSVYVYRRNKEKVELL